MATVSGTRSKTETDSKIRASAIRQAQSLQEKKQLQTYIADLIVEAYDLPSTKDALPDQPTAQNLKLFRKCLGFFQPSDFDDLVYERNVDDRCGYALCPQPKKKVVGAGEKVWNRRGGMDFQLVDKSELEKWCSKKCGERGEFVRSQLSTEPAWLREVKDSNIVFLHETDPNSETPTRPEDEVADRFKTLSLERGDSETQAMRQEAQISEKDDDEAFAEPPTISQDQSIEGHIPKIVRFTED